MIYRFLIDTVLASNHWNWSTNVERLSIENIPSNELDDRTQAVEIQLCDNDALIFIDPNIFMNFTSLAKFEMDRNRIYNFPSDKPFLRHSRVDTYSCRGCGVTGIYNRTFIELGALHTLVLSDNKIEYISPYAFRNNSKLNYLDLQSNQLKHFNEQGYLHNMHNIGYLLLSGNNEFNFLNNRTITGRIDTLKVFKCDGCAIDDACRILKSYSKIMELQLKDNRVTSFDCVEPRHAYQISLSGNPITSLKVSGRKLKYFYCAGCLLESLDDTMFKDAEFVQSVDLSKNKISTISFNTFLHNKRLEDLNLDSNFIRNFSLSFLNCMKSLTNLCVDENKLCPSYDNTEFKNEYLKRKLRTTCTSHHQFEKLLPSIASRTGKVLCERKSAQTRSVILDTLDLSSQNIAFLASDYLEGMDDVKFLNISHNQDLEFYENEPFLNNSLLNEIDFSYCSIRKIYKSTFISLPSLLKIDLSFNRITEIHYESFSHTTQLQDLILDGNLIDFLDPDSLSGLDHLTRLSMNNNSGFDIGAQEIFLNQRVLQEFYCEYCSITEISPLTFSQMPNLRKLVLSFNHIDMIGSQAFDMNKHLKYLNLDGNMLKTFDVNLINTLPELVHLCLDLNKEFDYKESKTNSALREYYVSKELRSPACAAKNDDDFLENRLPKPQIVKTEVINTKTMSKMSLNNLNSFSEPKKKSEEISDEDKNNIYDDYQDTPLQIDTYTKDEEKSEENSGEEQDIIKTGSIGGNAGNTLKVHFWGIMMTFLTVFLKIVH